MRKQDRVLKAMKPGRVYHVNDLWAQFGEKYGLASDRALRDALYRLAKNGFIRQLDPYHFQRTVEKNKKKPAKPTERKDTGMAQESLVQAASRQALPALIARVKESSERVEALTKLNEALDEELSKMFASHDSSEEVSESDLAKALEE